MGSGPIHKWWRNLKQEHRRRQNLKNRKEYANRPLPIQNTSTVQVNANGEVVAGEGTAAPTPPVDGTISTCKIGGACGNEIMYTRGRWEHTGKGDAECFGK